MANTFLAARGVDVGKSLAEHDLTGDRRGASSTRPKPADCTVHLPYDVVVAKEFAANPPSLRTCNVHEVAADEMILDIGPAAVEALADVLKTCRTLVWNGPLGAFETPPFDAATVALARTAAALTQEGSLVSVAGGGDTVAALNQAGVARRLHLRLDRRRRLPRMDGGPHAARRRCAYGRTDERRAPACEPVRDTRRYSTSCPTRQRSTRRFGDDCPRHRGSNWRRATQTRMVRGLGNRSPGHAKCGPAPGGSLAGGADRVTSGYATNFHEPCSGRTAKILFGRACGAGWSSAGSARSRRIHPGRGDGPSGRVWTMTAILIGIKRQRRTSAAIGSCEPRTGHPHVFRSKRASRRWTRSASGSHRHRLPAQSAVPRRLSQSAHPFSGLRDPHIDRETHRTKDRQDARREDAGEDRAGPTASSPRSTRAAARRPRRSRATASGRRMVERRGDVRPHPPDARADHHVALASAAAR